MNELNFKDFNLSEELLKSIGYLGYSTPSKVQQQVIPIALEGKDIIVKSQTGSGKTASFAIPLCEKIEIEERDPQVLVLTPTRELAVQVKEDITNIGRFKKIRASAIFGKQPMEMQKRELKQRVHIIVGTPGRTLDHLEKENINTSKISYLILDEADEMLSMGFIEQVEAIINKLPKDRITMLFSATIPKEIEALCNKYMKEPVNIEINSESTASNKIEQSWIKVEENKKLDALKRTLYVENPDSCIVFCRTKENVDRLFDRMNELQWPAIAIHGGMLQKDRLEAMESFKRGGYRFLVATDVAARGIDVENITHVINFDIPQEKESYVHRIGRTGRAGKEGKAISFVTPYENRFLNDIQQYIGEEIPEVELPSREEAEDSKKDFYSKNKVKPILKQPKSAAINKEITKLYINAGKKKKIRPGDIVGAISNINGVSADDIGIIDIQDNVSYVEILAGKGKVVLQALQNITIKGKEVKVQRANK